MGQQQLLLLVFGIVIVAVAIIAGLEAWSDKMNQSEADNLVNRNLEIANSAVFWKTKMDPFNGGDAKYIGLVEDGLSKLSMNSETASGEFAITNATNDALEITGIGTRNPNLGVRTWVNGYSVDSTSIDYTGKFTLED